MMRANKIIQTSSFGLLASLLLFTGCSTSTRTFTPRLFNPRAIEKQTGPAFSNVDLNRPLNTDQLLAGSAPYQVGVGDVFDIEIAGFPASRAQTFVLPDGTIYFDLAEGVSVEGLTLAEMRFALEKELPEYAEPELHLNLVESKSRRVMVLGQIKNPGSYTITRPTTLLEVLATAGGFAAPSTGQSKELADLQNAVLIRDGLIVPVNFDALIKDGDMTQNIYLQPRDYIFIPSANQQNIHVLGAVRAPQTMEYSANTTMISAIARANGGLPSAHLDRCIVVRGSLNRPRVAVVDVNNILSGTETNFLLKPGDIVWVPDRPWQFLERYLYAVIDSAARTIAVNEGARTVDEDARPNISISASGNN